MLSLKRSSSCLLLGAVAAAALAIAFLRIGRQGEGAAAVEEGARAGELSHREPEAPAPPASVASRPPERDAALAGLGSAEPAAREPGAVFVVEEAERFEPRDGAAHEHRLQYWRGRISPPVEDWAAMGLAEANGVSLSFALPDGERVAVVFKRFERYDARKGVYIASVEGRPFAEAMFSYVNDAVSGVLRFPAQGVSWEIRNAGGGAQFFEQVDLSKLGACAVCRPE